MPKEKNILSVLADNPALIDAVKAVLVKQFELPEDVGMMDDAVLGQKLRAYAIGKKAVENALKEIVQYKTTPDSPKRQNPAR